MKNLLLTKIVFLLIFLFGSETVQKKSDEIVKKENEGIVAVDGLIKLN